jgi:hypothetical protein
MKEWFSTAELAGVPGLPTTSRGVRLAAEANHWLSQERKHGKGLEYHISNFSTATQQHLRKHSAKKHKQTDAAQEGAVAGRELAITTAVDTATQQRAVEQGLKAVLSLNKTALNRADARLAILTALDEYTAQSPLVPSKAIVQFCAAYNAGTAVMDTTITSLIADIHPASIYRWRKTLAQEGTAALAGKYTTGKKSLVDKQPALQQFVLAMLTDYPHANAEHVYTAAQARFKNTEIELPSLRRLHAWLNNWKAENKQLFTAIANPDAWKNRFMVAQGSRSECVERLNQLWEMDSTPADVELVDGRHCIIGVIDVYSRRPLMLVSKTSKAAAVALAYRKALLAWGVNEIAKTDNGSDYTSKHMVRVFQTLGVVHEKCQPFSGDQKPHIERFFKTFSHGLVELLPNYIGHNVTDRQAIRARQSFSERLFKKDSVVKINMTAEELQRFCDRWITNVYLQRKHDGLKCTPFEMLASWRGGIRSIEDERALDVLLAEAPRGDGMATITKKGLKIDGIFYIAPEFGSAVDVGERVHVRFTEKLGLVYVFHHGQFICIAEAPEYRDIDRKEVAAVASARQAERTQAAKAAFKAAARKEKTKDIAEEILSAHEQDNNIARLPHRKVAYISDGLNEAAVAAAQMPVTESIAPVTHLPLHTTAPVESFDDPRKNHAAWLRIEMRITQGQWVSPQERDGLAVYKRSDEYLSMQDMFASFGLNADSFT